MAAINDVIAATQPAAAAAGVDTLTGTNSEQMSQRFLKLLVAQMRNQDPLSPLDNAQMTTQLAQINTVDGIERLNASMGAFTQSFASYQAVQATSLIGRQVMVPGSTLQLGEGGGQAAAWLDEPADSVRVSVIDRAGQVVDTMDLGPAPSGAAPFAWDGVRADGSAAPAGQYSFQVKALRGGSSVPATAMTWGHVTGATLSPQGTTVEVAGLGDIQISDIRQIQ